MNRYDLGKIEHHDILEAIYSPSENKNVWKTIIETWLSAELAIARICWWPFTDPYGAKKQLKRRANSVLWMSRHSVLIRAAVRFRIRTSGTGSWRAYRVLLPLLLHSYIPNMLKERAHPPKRWRLLGRCVTYLQCV